MNDIISIDKQHVANTYNRFPVEIVSGKGSRVVDTNGKEYIDMGSGIGVTAFGLADDVWSNAVAKQAATLSGRNFFFKSSDFSFSPKFFSKNLSFFKEKYCGTAYL